MGPGRGHIAISGFRGLWAGLVVLVGGACGPSEGGAPMDVPPGTTGEEIFAVFCEQMAAAADPRDVTGSLWKPACRGRTPAPPGAPPALARPINERSRGVTALDESLLSTSPDDLAAFVQSLLPLVDPPQERLVVAARRSADALEQLTEDPAALSAFERSAARAGYRPLAHGLGPVRAFLGDESIDAFVAIGLRALTTGSSREPFLDLLRAAALEMATAMPPEAPSSLSVVRHLLMDERAAYAEGPAFALLLRDGRGVARPRAAPGNAVPAPFIDLDADGLADVDAVGRLLGESGAPADVAAPFLIPDEAERGRDDRGRAIRDGSLVYAYAEGEQTLLSAVVAEARTWMTPDDPPLLALGQGLAVLLGPPSGRTSTYGAFDLAYEGFETTQSGLLDVVAALTGLLGRPSTDDTLAVLEALVRDDEPSVAGLLRTVQHVVGRYPAYPDARLTPGSTFWDDAIALVADMAQEPGLIEALLQALADPRTARLDEVLAEFMLQRDRVNVNAADVNGPPVGFSLDVLVDRAVADTFDNESVFQRTVALIDGLNGVSLCNRAGGRLQITLDVFGTPVELIYPLNPERRVEACELIRIDNLVDAYARSTIGAFELEISDGLLAFLVGIADALGIDVDQALETSSGIEGLTRFPTPEALKRLVFWALADANGGSCAPGDDGGSCNSAFAGRLFAPVVDRHGDLAVERYPGTIFAWQRPGFLDGLAPLVELLHGPTYGPDVLERYYFGDLIRLLHTHWASPANTQTCGPSVCTAGAPRFSAQSDIRRHEPLIADALADGRLFMSLHRALEGAASVQIRPGSTGLSAVAATAEVLVDPGRNPGFADRAGREETVVADGSRAVPMTPLYMLIEGLGTMDDAWAGDADRRSEFLRARNVVATQLLTTEDTDEGPRWENRRGKAIVETLLAFVRERVRVHREVDDLQAWADGIEPRFAEFVGGPLPAAAIRLLSSLNEDALARAAILRPIVAVVAPGGDDGGREGTLRSVADALAWAEDPLTAAPLLRGLAPTLAPNVRTVTSNGAVPPDVEAGLIYGLLELLLDIVNAGQARVLWSILADSVDLRSMEPPVLASTTTSHGTTPVETLLEIVGEVNRVAPSERGRFSAADFGSVLARSVDFLRSERSGFERLVDVLQSRRCPSAPKARCR